MLSLNTILQNRYRIIRQLGQGGMGTVYEALDQRVSAIVALKETVVGDNEEARRAFEREAGLLANLHHQSLSKVMDYFIEDSGEYLVMEYIPGYDLAELLRVRGAPFEVKDVLGWAEEILKVLEYLHGRPSPILHRDIKPSNLKLTRQGEVFLLDFGLAKGAAGQMQTLLTSRSMRGYTPIYASLEQIHGKGTDPRSDLYSLGATLYHLLTNVPPVDAPTRFDALEDEKPDPLRPAHELNPQVPPSVSAVIQQAMSVSRKHRHTSATEMRHALRRAEEEARQAAEEERHREAERKLYEAEERRKIEEEERQRRALEERERLLAEEEAARKLAAEEEAARRLEEEQRARAEEETRRRAAAAEVEEADRRRAEEVLRRMEAEAVRRREEEAERLRAEEEARQRAQAEERQRRKDEKRRKAIEEERQRVEAEIARIRYEVKEAERRRAAEGEKRGDEILTAVAAQPTLDAPTASTREEIASQAQRAQDASPTDVLVVAPVADASSGKVLRERRSAAHTAATLYSGAKRAVKDQRVISIVMIVVLISITVVFEYALRQRRNTGGSQTANENQATSGQSGETSTASPAGMTNGRGPLTNDPGASNGNLNSNKPRSEGSPTPPTVKNLSPVQVTDSGITITSDAPLNDYESYRSGDRYYLVLPHVNAPGVPNKRRGRGFDDVQIHERDDGIVISFRIKPGASAHVDPMFNKLIIIVNLPDTTQANTTSSANSQTRARRASSLANER